MTTVNADYESIYMNAGCHCKVSDGYVIGTTNFYETFQRNRLNIISIEDTKGSSYFVFADDNALRYTNMY
jgi:hypothetical protein